eukprot:3435188-Amphidinium_carterae.1
MRRLRNASILQSSSPEFEMTSIRLQHARCFSSGGRMLMSLTSRIMRSASNDATDVAQLAGATCHRDEGAG